MPADSRHLVAHHCDRRYVRGHLGDTEIPSIHGSAEMFGPIDADSIVRQMQSDGRSVYPLLDRFVFLIPEQQEAQNQLFWSFFDAIAGRYETLIDVRFNLHNIYSLLTKLSLFIGNLQDRLILDFGCGTGLALGPIHESHAEVIGVDAAATMREIAASRGMRVVSPAELLALPEEFDGVIASYVFHLSPDATAIFAMWSKLKSGGAVVANFHKNLGRDSVSRMFESLGAEPTELDVTSDEVRHGSYIAFRKR